MIYIVRGEKADAPVCSPHCDLSAAIRLAAAMEARGSTVRIFSVGEDGAETMLPTYEEALAEIAAAHAALDPIVGRRDAASDPPLCLTTRATTAATIALDLADKRDSDAAIMRDRWTERDALLTLLDRVDYDGKSLPGELREDIGKALDAARKAGWRRA